MDTTSLDTRALGVLLAGGRGERLRLAVPKAHAVLAGRTLFARALGAVAHVCARVWIVAPASMTLPDTDDVAATVERVADAEPGAGPLAALAALLRAPSFAAALAAAGVRVVTLAVDLPFVTDATIRTLLARFDGLVRPDGGAFGLVPAPGGRLQPLAAVWSPAALHAMAEACSRGERSIVRAASTLPLVRLDDAALAAAGLDAVTRDVDTTDDLAAAARALDDANGERT